MLAALLNIPHTDSEWAQWSFAHKDSHDRIRAAIKKQYGANLTDFQIDPMSTDSIDLFLQNNSQLHDDMNGTLNLQSINLDIVDLSKDNERDAWINFHYLEHYYAESKLGI